MKKGVSLAVLVAALLHLAPVATADEGMATWYGPGFHGRTMANGQVYDQYDPTTTASNRHPFGTWLKVTNPSNGRSVYVQVRDRGGFSHALDLSYAAFRVLEDPAKMWVRVTYDVVSGPGAEPAAPAPAPAPAATPVPERSQPSARADRTEAPVDRDARQHTVKPGDTLWSISKRYGVTVAALQQLNGLGESDIIRDGQSLALRAGAASAAAPGAGGAGQEHVVAPGEVIGTIAERYGVSVEALAQANGLADPYLIRVGERLMIPGGAGAAPEASAGYVVQEGDTLFGIAMANGLDPEELARLNGLDDPNMLQPGQELRLN